jgi:DNA-binding MarR family transcriptional regulator
MAAIEQRRAVSAASEAWRLMFEYFVSLDPYLEDIAGEFGLSDSQGHALVLLEPGGGLPMHELAERLHCHASNVTAIVDALEARGLVERRPGERDRRVKIVALTGAGAELRARALERLFRPPPGIAELSAADQRALRDILRRVVGA